MARPVAGGAVTPKLWRKGPVSDMEITRNPDETRAGPGEWFTGEVYVDTVATPSGQSRL